MQVLQVASSGWEASEQAFADFFPDARIGAGDGHGFTFDLEVHSSGPLTVLEYRFEGRRIHATASSPGFTVCDVQLVGELSEGRTPIDPALPFVFPPQLEATRTSSFSRLIDIDPAALQRYVAQYVGDEAVTPRMAGILPRSPALGELWRSTAAYIVGAVKDGSADHPLIAATMGDLALATFVTVFPTDALDRPERGESGPRLSAAVRRAQVFMDEHFAEPITAVDIAAASRLSIRGLQDAFRRQTGRTPMRYLRRVRLEAARRELLGSDSSARPVIAEVARAAGFVQLSRFAAACRDEYGELPSQTVTR